MENKIDGFTISFVKKVFPSHENHELPREKAEVKVDFSGTISPDALSILLDRTSDLMTAISTMSSVPIIEPRIERHASMDDHDNENIVEVPIRRVARNSGGRVMYDTDDSSDSDSDDLPVLEEIDAIAQATLRSVSIATCLKLADKSPSSALASVADPAE